MDSDRKSKNSVLVVDDEKDLLDLISYNLQRNGFKVLTATSVSGTFATVNGTAINASEHFTVQYNSNNVTLEVVSGP